MAHTGQHHAPRNPVAAQPVGDEAPWCELQVGQQALEEALGRRCVPTVLHEDVQHRPALVASARPRVTKLAMPFAEMH